MDRATILCTQRTHLIAYLQDKILEHDWHGVCDAANDLREVEAELRGLGFPVEK